MRSFALFIDPGHGGGNNGTLALGRPEKDATLEIAKRLALSFHGVPGVQSLLSRYEDKSVGLKARGEMSAEWGTDLTVVIHVNALHSESVHGMECYILPHQEASLRCADGILNAAPKELRPGRTIVAQDPRPDQGGDWIEHPINTMKYHAPRSAVILVECGYATNLGDRVYLNSRFGIDSVVTSIRAGVLAAASFIDKA